MSKYDFAKDAAGGANYRKMRQVNMKGERRFVTLSYLMCYIINKG